MKARIYNINIDGTPDEIIEFMDKARQNKDIVREFVEMNIPQTGDFKGYKSTEKRRKIRVEFADGSFAVYDTLMQWCNEYHYNYGKAHTQLLYGKPFVYEDMILTYL